MKIANIFLYYLKSDLRNKRLHVIFSSVLIAILISIAEGGWPTDWKVAFGMLISFYLTFIGLFIYPLKSDLLAVLKGSDADPLLLYPISHKKLFILSLLYSFSIISIAIILYYIFTIIIINIKYNITVLININILLSMIISILYAGLFMLFSMLASGISKDSKQAIGLGYFITFILIPSISLITLYKGLNISVAPFYLYIAAITALYGNSNLPKTLVVRPVGPTEITIPVLTVGKAALIFAVYYILLIIILYYMFLRNLR